jgi:hypothetical protein
LVRLVRAPALVARHFHETPAQRTALCGPSAGAKNSRVAKPLPGEIRAHLNAATSYNNYEYLDILDRAWRDGVDEPRGRSALRRRLREFLVREALQAFFRPSACSASKSRVYRLYRDGHSRIDYAAGVSCRHAECAVPDRRLRALRVARRLITAWFPFVTARLDFGLAAAALCSPRRACSSGCA